MNPATGKFDLSLDPFWSETKECAGFFIGDECPWRPEEM
jgi:hypothetical protein